MKYLNNSCFILLYCSYVQANTQLLSNAAETLTFNSIDQLDQGAGTLYTITSQLTKGGDVAKTLDMKGREAAVQLIEVKFLTPLLNHCFDFTL